MAYKRSNLDISTMSKFLNSTAVGSWKDKGGKRTPLYTWRELATEFGISINQLAYRMSNSPIPVPEPRLRTTKGIWYEPKEMRAWWKEYNKVLTEKKNGNTVATSTKEPTC